MRLIDADANIETMKKCAENPEDKYALLCYRYAQRVLEEAPTVEPASPWHRVEEPPKYSGKVFVLMNREGPFYDIELVADTVMYNRLPRGPVPVGTFYKGLFGESDFEDVTKNVLYWMPVELPEEDA